MPAIPSLADGTARRILLFFVVHRVSAKNSDHHAFVIVVKKKSNMYALLPLNRSLRKVRNRPIFHGYRLTASTFGAYFIPRGGRGHVYLALYAGHRDAGGLPAGFGRIPRGRVYLWLVTPISRTLTHCSSRHRPRKSCGAVPCSQCGLFLHPRDGQNACCDLKSRQSVQAIQLKYTQFLCVHYSEETRKFFRLIQSALRG